MLAFLDFKLFSYIFLEYILYKLFLYSGEWTTEAYNSAYFLCKSNGIGQAVIEYHINDNIYTNIYFTVQNYGVSIYNYSNNI